MNKVFSFIKGSVDEMTNNVTWSKYSELQSSTILVIIASMVFAILIGFIDLLFKNVMEYIYQLFQTMLAMSELLNWYVIRAVSGQEKKVKGYLENEIVRQKLG